MQDDYYDLGTFTRSVTTDSDEAQRWFDLGLNWLYGFNHPEGVKCFRKAIEADPSCAMAHWGVAIGKGPNYNATWDALDDRTLSKNLSSAYDATQEALALVDNVTPVEAALIGALPIRYPQRDPLDPVEGQHEWNLAFTAAMRDIATQYPDDLEVQATLSLIHI